MATGNFKAGILAVFQGRFPSSKIPGRNKIIGMFDAEWILMLFDNLTDYLLSWPYIRMMQICLRKFSTFRNLWIFLDSSEKPEIFSLDTNCQISLMKKL